MRLLCGLRHRPIPRSSDRASLKGGARPYLGFHSLAYSPVFGPGLIEGLRVIGSMSLLVFYSPVFGPGLIEGVLCSFMWLVWLRSIPRSSDRASLKDAWILPALQSGHQLYSPVFGPGLIEGGSSYAAAAFSGAIPRSSDRASLKVRPLALDLRRQPNYSPVFGPGLIEGEVLPGLLETFRPYSPVFGPGLIEGTRARTLSHSARCYSPVFGPGLIEGTRRICG